ncbi:MAG: hypothetical protein IBX64_03960 [Actinobacteria bacterium]|nr:hypothetical protein [Actinomycetota bacterium]
MKKVKVFTLLLVAILAVSAVTAYGYGRMFGKTVVRAEATYPDFDKNELVSRASVIVSGKVVSLEVQDDFTGVPATDYIIKVDKVFKGNPAAEVEVRTEGGENAEMIYIPDEGVPTFQIGEKVVLFLTDEKGDRPDKDDFGYYVLGGHQGKFIEENGKLKNEKFTFDVATFEQEIAQIEKDNKAKGLKKLKADPGDDI